MEHPTSLIAVAKVSRLQPLAARSNAIRSARRVSAPIDLFLFGRLMFLRVPQYSLLHGRLTMNIVRKDATITNTDDAFPGEFEVILSAPTKDRDGETLLPDEWKQPLPDRITFDADHGMSVASTVGSGVPTLNDAGELKVAGTYSSLARAQEVRTLVNEGHIRTTSVAFMTEKSPQKDGKGKVTRELLNGAFVAVPSNREALVLSSKGVKAGARNSASDMAHVQAIHDHALSLGATPATKAFEGKAAGEDGMCAGCGAPCCAACAMCESCAACPTCVACGCPDCCGTCGACACPACCAACVSLAAGCCAGAAHCESCADCTACCPCSCAACCATCPTCTACACPTCCAANTVEGSEPSAAADETDALDVQNRSLQAQAYVTE